MLLKVYSIYDKTVQAYGDPLPAPHVGHILRFFETQANDPNSKYCRWPDQFELHEIGTFCQTSAEMKSCTPTVIQSAKEAKHAETTPLRTANG